MKIRVGSRDSKLAVVQSRIVMDAIQARHPEIELELVTMKTTGDIILDKTLDKIGGKGLFVKELDRALLKGEVDITVHSLKDMPMETDERLPIVAVSKRENPRDVLVLPVGKSEIDFSKPIGCSSARRRIQLERLYPACRVAPVRGNLQTRLRKLDSPNDADSNAMGEEFSALVLAYAGLKRLSLEERISRVFSVEEMLPAACQGVLVAQARADFDRTLLAGFHDEDTFVITLAERSFVRTLDGGCSSPVAAYGELEGEILTLTGLYVNGQGEMSLQTKSGSRSDPEGLGKRLAEEMATDLI